MIIKNSSFIARIAVFAYSLLLIQSCSYHVSLPERPPADARSNHNPGNLEPFEMPSGDFSASQREIAEFSSEIESMIKKKDFAGLERKTREYRENKARFIGGGWKIASVNLYTTAPKSDSKTVDWQSSIEYLKEWKLKFPDSIEARSALIGAYIGYAWEARGDKYADTVSAEAWQIFKERLTMAGAEADEAAILPDRCHAFYFQLLTLARAQQWDRADYEKLFEEAIAYEPTYQYYYTEKATYLMPRWHGRPGEWEAFATDVKTKFGGKKGLQMYYFIVQNLQSPGDSRRFFVENNPSWIEAREGFRLIIQEYGVSRRRLSEFAQVANKAADADASCKTFAYLQGEDGFDPGVWGSRKQFDFEKQVSLDLCRSRNFTAKNK